ncbi:LuxR family transcriptional regulator [Nocardioides sp. Root122]|uniref:helix-turn-helix transcriptional regulator n=1 Tax=Nocardioides TaxID=1839 RepID=UPI0007031406|nr:MULTISPECIES: LuxR C-terminal-related transcriptional regulator [Nocardioides]KQV77968.1 LuxR family transcriptional regulator [Nocardioides sp. Root122]MCK9825110.1 LuxR C-terminal-related transcriptional regulator [Nocardioides cavernae]
MPATAVLAERVRRDVDVLSRAGLDLETFLAEAVDSVGRAVPAVGVCLGTHDPATFLLTSARKYGALAETNTYDHEFGLIEYGTVEPTAFGELARAAVPAAGVHALTGGDVERSGRMSRFMKPNFGFADELRLVFREAGAAWGAMALFRGPDDVPFGTAEIEFMASLTEVFARGVRTGMLCRLSSSEVVPVAGGPAVLIVGADDTVRQMSLGAEARLAELGSGDVYGDPAGMVSALVGAARRLARGETSVPPRSRIRTAGGTWLVLHAAPLSGAGGDVVVTIEEARPPEIVPLVVAAFDLTPRERDVTQLVLQGLDTKEIAATLHVSPWTVQDHLKTVFLKADVRSRRELISRVYFEQYVPRMGDELSPSGWFTPGVPGVREPRAEVSSSR